MLHAKLRLCVIGVEVDPGDVPPSFGPVLMKVGINVKAQCVASPRGVPRGRAY